MVPSARHLDHLGWRRVPARPAVYVHGRGAAADADPTSVSLQPELQSRRPYALMFEIDTFVRSKMWFVFPIREFGRLFTFANHFGKAGVDVWPTVSEGWVFALGLLLPYYTITGYDASAHISKRLGRLPIRCRAASSRP